MESKARASVPLDHLGECHHKISLQTTIGKKAMKIHIQEAAVSETKQIKAKIVQIIEESLQNFNTNFRFEAKIFALKQK